MILCNTCCIFQVFCGYKIGFSEGKKKRKEINCMYYSTKFLTLAVGPQCTDKHSALSQDSINATVHSSLRKKKQFVRNQDKKQNTTLNTTPRIPPQKYMCIFVTESNITRPELRLSDRCEHNNSLL